MTSHMLTVTRNPDLYAEISCDKVTDACAEWTECNVPECPGNTGGDDTLYDVSPWAHGEEHQRFDEQADKDFWGVRTGACWAASYGDVEATDFAEEHHLEPGQYRVDVEVDGIHTVITWAPAETTRAAR